MLKHRLLKTDANFWPIVTMTPNLWCQCTIVPFNCSVKAAQAWPCLQSLFAAVDTVHVSLAACLLKSNQSLCNACASQASCVRAWTQGPKLNHIRSMIGLSDFQSLHSLFTTNDEKTTHAVFPDSVRILIGSVRTFGGARALIGSGLYVTSTNLLFDCTFESMSSPGGNTT